MGTLFILGLVFLFFGFMACAALFGLVALVFKLVFLVLLLPFILLVLFFKLLIWMILLPFKLFWGFLHWLF